MYTLVQYLEEPLEFGSHVYKLRCEKCTHAMVYMCYTQLMPTFLVWHCG